MPPSGTVPRVEGVQGKRRTGFVWRSLYSGLIVIAGVALAFVAFALTIALRS
jgi:LPS O-antigen subunit length determinant protein (WzzB/FepE family)